MPTAGGRFEKSIDDAMEVLKAEMGEAAADGVDDSTIEILINNATERFGFAPRDVYKGIFSPTATWVKHKIALDNLDYRELITLSKAIHLGCEFDEDAHHVIAASPVTSTLSWDEWTINFKSMRIAEQAVLSMWSLGEYDLRDMYALLHGFPQNSGIAGRIFEAIAHRVIPGKEVLQSTPMDTNGEIPPTFSTTAPQPPPTSRRDHAMTFRTINLRHDLSDVTFDSSGYYVPVSAFNPLFNSFTVALDVGRRTGVISIYQITISQSHRGSADDYLLIHKIMAHARKLLNCPKGYDPDIKVEYFLVCPEDGVDYEWEMPSGWDENNGHDNQAGEAFCIRIPSRYLTQVCRTDPIQIL